MHELTARELEVARLLSEVKTFSEIGTELGISPRTVKQYADSTRLKLGVSRSRDIPRVLKELGVI